MNRETELEDVIPLSPDNAVRTSEVAELRRLSLMQGQREFSPVGPWDVIEGSGVVFSAPHEVAHIRDGIKKVAEHGTAALAFALAQYTRGSGIATAEDQSGDPNWDLDHSYFDRARELAASGPVVDIHMMRPRGIDLCIGLGPIPALAQDLWPVFVDEAVSVGLRVSLNWPFGGNIRTVTARFQNSGNRAIQLELSWECFDQKHLAMERAWSALARAARRIAT